MDLWEQLKEHTQARIGLHRSGHSVSTRDLLEFQLAHAMARDTVQETWDAARFEKKLKTAGEKPLKVKTSVDVRELYLKFPNRGRTLNKESREKLINYRLKHPVDIVFIVTDGLSPRAIDRHAIPFWKAMEPLIKKRFAHLKTTLVIVPFGRVALSDDIGKALGVKISVMLVGERPGLTSADSLGIYLTYAPKPGNTDADRNCISNVHPPEGMAYAIAAEKLAFLIAECLRLKISGVGIKEQEGQLIA